MYPISWPPLASFEAKGGHAYIHPVCDNTSNNNNNDNKNNNNNNNNNNENNKNNNLQIDKKSHKAKDSTQLSDVLQSIKPSEFKDHSITCYKVCVTCYDVDVTCSRIWNLPR